MSMDEEIQKLQQELERDGFLRFREVGPLYKLEVEPEIDATVRKLTRPTKVTSRPRTPRVECMASTTKPRIIADVPWTKPVKIIRPEAKRATPRRPVPQEPEPATTAPEPAPAPEPVTTAPEPALETVTTTTGTYRVTVPDGVVADVPQGFTRFRININGTRYALRLTVDGALRTGTTLPLRKSKSIRLLFFYFIFYFVRLK